MSSTARILDVNINRAREALRVMEDAARFALDDVQLSSELKVMRHELRQAIACLNVPAGWLEANRNATGDVAAKVSPSSEMTRASLLDSVIAAAKRLGESLRVIEEISKAIQPNAAAHLKALRYRGYAMDSRL